MVNTPTLSIVIPLYNEAAVIPHLVSRLNQFADHLPSKTECIVVDDGSTDATFETLTTANLKLKVKVIRLSRNFGHQAALLAGLEIAGGQYIVTLDGDLQHPLELIPEMLKQHKNGIDIVLTQRLDGSETNRGKRHTASWFYRIMNLLSTQKVQPNSSDFRSLNRAALNSLLSMPENRKFLRGMVAWIGFSQIVLPFQVQARVEGTSKYSLSKMWRLAVEGISSFSTMPLYISAFFGVILFVAAVFYASYVVFVRYVLEQAVQGWASVLFVQLVIGGFLSLFLGVIGIYLAAIYDEVKDRPSYIIRQKYEN